MEHYLEKVVEIAPMVIPLEVEVVAMHKKLHADPDHYPNLDPDNRRD